MISLSVALGIVIVLVVGFVAWKATSSGDQGDASPTVLDGTDRTVGLLRETDPVCDDWLSYADELAAAEEQWAASNDGIPASRWSPEQREVFENVGVAMSTAADQFESILPKSHNVVLQELIAQTIVYLRAYVDRMPKYVGSDGLIAGVASNFGSAVSYMCSAVPLVSSEGGDVLKSSAQEPTALTAFLTADDSICEDLLKFIERQQAMLGGWASVDSTTSADQWNADQRKLYLAVREVLEKDASKLQDIANSSSTPIARDLLVTQSMYMQAFAEAIPTYVPDDVQLWNTVTAIGGGMSAACKAVS